MLKKLASCAAIAAMLAGCTTSSSIDAGKTDLARAARAVAGTSLIGAKGATPVDQEQIDDTAAGLCGAKAWSARECARHGRASGDGV